jgi:uncharacterized Tic20 family protein
LAQHSLIQNAVTQNAVTQNAVTQDERTIALLAHMLQIMLWGIAPLAIFLIKRESKFVSFHALQALLLQAVYVLLLVTGLVSWFGISFLIMAAAPASKHAPPIEFFILIPMLWLCLIGMGVLVLLAAIVYGRQGRARRMGWVSDPGTAGAENA